VKKAGVLHENESRVSEECITHLFTTGHCKGSATDEGGGQGINGLIPWDFELLTIFMHVVFVNAAKLGPQVSDHLLACDIGEWVLECGELARVGWLCTGDI
jgi:hypothetical protein